MPNLAGFMLVAIGPACVAGYFLPPPVMRWTCRAVSWWVRGEGCKLIAVFAAVVSASGTCG